MLLTNEAKVFAVIEARPRVTARQIALATGLTERTALLMVRNLEDAGFLSRRLEGRSNVYTIHASLVAGVRAEAQRLTALAVVG